MSGTPQLPQQIRELIDYELARETRIHKINTNGDAPDFWIKREDELSSGIAGSKLRKYASLLPFLRVNNIDVVGIIGGPNSNNLVGLAQILKENAIQPVAFIRKPSDQRLQGNALLLDLLLDSKSKHFIDHAQWPKVETIAEDTLKSLYPQTITHVLSEGCFSFEALPGALTLAEDTVRNEVYTKQRFSHIFIDSGTGLSAIGLILGLELLRPADVSEREIVITHIAGDESTFETNLKRFRSLLQERFGLALDSPIKLRHTYPPTAKKYGHINSTVLAECGYIAKHLGILMDPVYSVKHYMAFREIQRTLPEKANSLFVYNGSTIGLMGFQRALSRDEDWG